MNDITKEIIDIIGQSENGKIEYKAVLPPSKNIARLISAFANTDGGYIILGVKANIGLPIEVIGLSQDFYANSIIHKALDLLEPQPSVFYQYITFQSKKIYAIKVNKSDRVITVEGKKYLRYGTEVKQIDISEITYNPKGYSRIIDISQQLDGYKKYATNTMINFISHYQSVLKMIDELEPMLYPVDVNTPSRYDEGKILSRILFSSCVDNFETYLSGLLYEIYLSNPMTLKSNQTVTIEEVLNCSDLQEFVKYWAKQKIQKLQKGSVKGFIKENKQIAILNAMNEDEQSEVERILQIRHLYSHRNGLVDEKFLHFFAGEFELNSEHRMPISEICNKLEYLSRIAYQIDVDAIQKYNLAPL